MLAALLVAAAATRLFAPLAPSFPEVAPLAPAAVGVAAPAPALAPLAEPRQSGGGVALGWVCAGAAAGAVAALAVQGTIGARPAAASVRTSRTTTTRMINLFGNNDESKRRRDALSFRDAQAGQRKVTFRKPNAATTCLLLGLKFRESFGKGVFVDKIVPGTEAARLKAQGKVKEGDEVVMVSATFGNEMWSARGIGKQRLEKTIAVRQGMNVSLVLENPKDKGSFQQDTKRQRELMSRMQKQLQSEVTEEKKKGWFNF